MKNLVLIASLSIGLIGSSGCFIESSDDGDPFANFDVAWILEGGCPVGATTAEVVSTDSSNRDFETLFDCDAGSGVTQNLPLDDYSIVVNITDDSTNDLFAQSDAILASLNTDLEIVELDFSFPTDGGFFELSWTMTDTNDAAITCGDAGADGISVLATLAGTTSAVDEIFVCAPAETGGSAIGTEKVELGDHVVQVTALDGNDPLASSDAKNATVEFGNEIVDLGNFDFVFAAL